MLATMRKAVLIYNPMAGRRREQRLAEVERAAAVLRQAGVATETVATLGAGSAGEQAREAITAGCDTVFACGGDGTVNDVLQGLAGAPAALGIIPAGTANSLANDLGLPRDPGRVARLALASQARGVAAGKITYGDPSGTSHSRFFLVAAGIGPDAHLFYSMSMKLKDRAGVSAYYAEALRVWATHGYPLFEVEYDDCSTGETCRATVSQVLAVRIANFGGLLRRLAPGAGLCRDDLRLVLFKTAERSTYLRYMTGVMLRHAKAIPGVEFASVNRLACRPINAQPNIYAEIDGELLGKIPVEMEVVAGAVNLLVPPGFR
jgi:YegS/Rv2252/BmrU family lipid kinase